MHGGIIEHKKLDQKFENIKGKTTTKNPLHHHEQCV